MGWSATHLDVKGQRIGYLAELFEFRGRTHTREITTKPFPRWILSRALKGPPIYEELAEIKQIQRGSGLVGICRVRVRPRNSNNSAR